MKRPTILPVEETVTHKTDNLDWDSLGSQTCELEYRPTINISPAAHLRVGGMLLLVSVLAPPVALVLWLTVARYVWNWQAAIVAVILAILMVSGYQLRQFSRPHRHRRQLIDSRTFLLLVLPPFVWLVVAMTAIIDRPVGAFLYLVGVALPVAVFAADRIATHALYWVTADIQIDSETVRSCREEWANRFLGSSGPAVPESEANETDTWPDSPAVREARTNYWLGVLWLLGAVVFPTCLVLLISTKPNPNTIGLQLLIAVCLGLTGAVLLRTGGTIAMFAKCWQFLVHWLHYASDGPTPPWVFQSPGGSARQRRLVVVLAVGMISIAMAYLSIRPLLFVVAASATDTSSPSIHAEAGTSIVHPPTTLTEQYERLTPIRLVVLITLVLVGAFLPIIVFFLCTLIFAAPVIVTYYNALESWTE